MKPFLPPALDAAPHHETLIFTNTLANSTALDAAPHHEILIYIQNTGKAHANIPFVVISQIARALHIAWWCAGGE